MKLKEIEKISKEIFLEKSEIIAAYVYGSYLKSEFFEDIDLGLLVKDGFKPEVLFEEKISILFEKKLKGKFKAYKPIDIRLLNGKSLRFLYSVLKNSKLIFSRDDYKRIQFESKVIKEYLDIKPHHDLYDAMRRLRYAIR